MPGKEKELPMLALVLERGCYSGIEGMHFGLIDPGGRIRGGLPLHGRHSVAQARDLSGRQTINVATHEDVFRDREDSAAPEQVTGGDSGTYPDIFRRSSQGGLPGRPKRPVKSSLN